MAALMVRGSTLTTDMCCGRGAMAAPTATTGVAKGRGLSDDDDVGSCTGIVLVIWVGVEEALRGIPVLDGRDPLPPWAAVWGELLPPRRTATS